METFKNLTPQETSEAHSLLAAAEMAARQAAIALATSDGQDLLRAENELRAAWLDLSAWLNGIGCAPSRLNAGERSAAMYALQLSIKGMDVAQELVDKGHVNTSPDELESMHIQRAALKKLLALLEHGAE